MYTGTSVSTAAVSAVAAVIWDLRPDFKAAQVMKWIAYIGEVSPHPGRLLPLETHLLVETSPARFSLCQTVLRMCGPDVGLCRPKLETLDCRLGGRPPADFIYIAPSSRPAQGSNR